MNKHTTTPRTVQPLTAADMAHIHALAGRDNKTLALQCASHRRRVRRWRSVTAVLLFSGICLAWTTVLAHPRYDEVTTTGGAGGTQLCNIVYDILGNV
jgi:hypothetical protein